MIYCVEDDDSIRELVVYALQSAGYTAKGCIDGKEMWQAVEAELPQLIILDVMLPETSGIDLLKQLRKNAITAQLPIIMASAKGSEYDKVKGLDSGADDYIAKPFGVMELISRVNALLRRSKATVQQTVDVGEITIDLQKHKVYVANKEIVLTRKEFDFLQLLMSSPERVFTRDTVLSTVWGYDFDGETRTVDVHMRALRQKLGNAGKQLETVRGVGYRIKLKHVEETNET